MQPPLTTFAARLTRIAALSPAIEADRSIAKKYLYANFYNSPGMEEEHERAARVVQELFSTLMTDPGLLPPTTRCRFPPKASPAPSPTTSPE